MDTNSFINQVKSYRKSTLNKALQINSFANGGPTDPIPPYITSDPVDYYKRKQAYADSLTNYNAAVEFDRIKRLPSDSQEKYEAVRQYANKYFDRIGYSDIDRYPTEKIKGKIEGASADNKYYGYYTPKKGVETSDEYISGWSGWNRTSYDIAHAGNRTLKPRQQVIYQEKPKTYNYEVSREIQYPNTQSARIWRILINNNEYNLNPNEEDYPVDPRYKGINDTVTEVERNAWNRRFNIEPYTKEMTEDEAAELEKQGYTVRRYDFGGPTENYFGELLPTVTIHPQDNTRVSNTPYINPVYDEDSHKYLTGRPYALYAKELDWNDYIDNGYFFGINPNDANKHFTDSPKGAFLKAYEMNPNIDGLHDYIFEHMNDYNRFGDNNPKPLELNLKNGKINKTLQGRTITEDLKNSIQSAAKKYNVDPYDILAHFFLEANDTIIDNNTYPNLHDTRYLQVKKQSPALSEFFIDPEEKDLAANMKILQKDGTYDQQKLMDKVSKELPKLKNIPVSESYADEVAWMIANGHRDFNPKQKGYRAPTGKINHSYIEMLDDAIPILKQTKLFD